MTPLFHELRDTSMPDPGFGCGWHRKYVEKPGAAEILGAIGAAVGSSIDANTCKKASQEKKEDEPHGK